MTSIESKPRLVPPVGGEGSDASASVVHGVQPDTITYRLRVILRDQSYAEIARAAGFVSAATVRRFLIGHEPSTRFLAWLVHELGADAEYLLTGSGPIWASERQRHTLRTVPTVEMLLELGVRISRLEGERGDESGRPRSNAARIAPLCTPLEEA